MADDPTDEQIEARLRVLTPDQWLALEASVDAVRADATPVSWGGGEQVGTVEVDGVERPVRQAPYGVFSPALEQLIAGLYRLDLIVPFDWPRWPDADRYREGLDVETAPVADAVRLITTIVRADRFVDGTIGAALDDGRLLAALDRVRAWSETVKENP